MNLFPIQFADDLICFNVIGSKDKPNFKTVGYFTIAKNIIEARRKLKKLALKDTNEKDPFKLWNSSMLLGHVKVVKDLHKEMKILIKNTEDHQRLCIKNLKKIMKKPKLVGDDDLALWTFLHCSKRQYFLFDPDGAAIEDRNYLNTVISKYKNYKKINGKLYFQEFVISY